MVMNLFKTKFKIKNLKKTKFRRLEGAPLVASIVYNKKIAMSFHNTKYYEAQSEYQSSLVELERVKLTLSTSHKERVTTIFEEYKKKGESRVYAIHGVLFNIREKTMKAIINKKPLPKVDDILSVVGNINVLLCAYRTIKGNVGALSSAWEIPIAEANRLSDDQRILLDSLFNLPDALQYKLLRQISSLIKNGAYPWGVSKLIWIPKPGTKKMRPLTIPPFADRLVQEAIRMVLEAIYDPVFQKMNCSFGFRASNGVHQAISMLTEQRGA